MRDGGTVRELGFLAYKVATGILGIKFTLGFLLTVVTFCALI